MERLRKLTLSYRSLGYHYSRRIVPTEAYPTAPLVSERFNQCKPRLPFIQQNLSKRCVSSSSSHDRQVFAAGSLVGERFTKCKPRLPSIYQNFTKSRGFSSSSHFRLNFLPKSKPKRYFSLFLKLIAALLLVPVVYLGFQYFRYANRNSDYLDRRVADEMLRKKKAANTLGEILPASHPHSVKACSILKTLLDALHRDLGLDETSIVTYHGDSTVVESNQNEITDGSLEENRINFRGWRMEPGQLKGLNWLVVVVDKPEQEAYTFGGGLIVVSSGLLDHHSNVEVAAVLAHQVAHCLARHVVESCALAIVAFRHNLKNGNDIHPILVTHHQRAEKEVDHIALELMGSAGYDPHMYEKLEINYSEYEENGPISLKGRIQLTEEVQSICELRG